MSRSDLGCTRVQEAMDWCGSDLRFGVSQATCRCRITNRQGGSLRNRNGPSNHFHCLSLVELIKWRVDKLAEQQTTSQCADIRQGSSLATGHRPDVESSFWLLEGSRWVGRVEDRDGWSSWDMSRLSWKVWQRLRACVGVARSRGRGVFGNRMARSTNGGRDAEDERLWWWRRRSWK